MKLIRDILEAVKRGEIEVSVAEKMILEMIKSSPNTQKNSGDFRDPQNYESQSQYFGR